MKEKTKKKILLIILCTLTILILYVAIRLNSNRKHILLSSSNIKGYLSEIRYEEISSHVKEQPNAVIYVSNSSQNESIKFENNFKNIVKKYNLENEIIYININETTIIDPIYQNAPELVFYKDGEINDIVDCNTLKSSKKIIDELRERGIIDD